MRFLAIIMLSFTDLAQFT